MKKIFAIALAFVLASSLLTACGGSGNGHDGGDSFPDPSPQTDFQAAEAPKTDPPPQGNARGVPQKLADGWPEGLPRYPDGDAETDWDIEFVIITVYGTSAQAASQYLETLKAAGWSVEGGLSMFGEAWSGAWYLNYSWDEPDFLMSLFWQQ